GRLLKGDVCRLERDGSICARANIFSKGPVSATEYLITRFELGDVFANCFNGSGKINAESNVLGLAQPDPHCAHDLGRAFDEVPVEWVDCSRADSHQAVIVRRSGFRDVAELQVR